MFNPTARLAAPVSLLIQGIPILNNTGKPANVNEVEVIHLIGPLLGCVIDLEAGVWRYPVRLNKGNFGANYGAIGMIVRKVTVIWKIIC